MRPAAVAPVADSAAVASVTDSAALAPATFAGIVLGSLVTVRHARWAVVALDGRDATRPTEVRSLVTLGPADEGRVVAVMFEEADPNRPVVIGRVEKAPALEPEPRPGSRRTHPKPSLLDRPSTAPADGEPLVIDASAIVLSGRKEVVLRCGTASITLTKDGQVVVRGARVESRSEGVNRIKGGSVQIN